MNDKERADYLEAMTPEIEAMVDAAMLKYTGRTHRPGDYAGASNGHLKPIPAGLDDDDS